MSLDAFLADPRTFLTANIVLPPVRGSAVKDDPGAHQQSGVFEFAFIQSDKPGKLIKGGTCPLFRVEKSDAYNTKSPRFRAYFCYYEPDELHMLVVGNAAGLMLTPRMDGCSFGVGSATPSGARLVGHANVSRTSSTQEGIAQQDKSQADLLNAAFQNASILGPSKYMLGSDVAGTTVGKRSGSQWSFFTQTWTRAGSDYTLRDVIDFA